MVILACFPGHTWLSNFCQADQAGMHGNPDTKKVGWDHLGYTLRLSCC